MEALYSEDHGVPIRGRVCPVIHVQCCTVGRMERLGRPKQAKVHITIYLILPFFFFFFTNGTCFSTLVLRDSSVLLHGEYKC